LYTNLEEDLSLNDIAFLNESDNVKNSNEYDIKYNRKEKSLGELCKRFLSIYGQEDKGLLLLDQCTKELGVERRRIYDIINILESFCVIRR
jgi:transcription factor E2F7/8